MVTTSTNIPTSAPTVLGKCGVGKYYTYEYYSNPIRYYCETCPLNYYCSDGTSSAACPSGKITAATGSTSSADCVSYLMGNSI